jgi:hypothetical protein
MVKRIKNDIADAAPAKQRQPAAPVAEEANQQAPVIEPAVA